MNDEGLWDRLIEALDDWTSAIETETGQIEVVVPAEGNPDRRVLVVMTQVEWEEDMAGTMWGNFDHAVGAVKRDLLRLGPHERFAVYRNYCLTPSAEPSLAEPVMQERKPREGPPVGPPRDRRYESLNREDRIADPPGPTRPTA